MTPNEQLSAEDVAAQFQQDLANRGTQGTGAQPPVLPQTPPADTHAAEMATLRADLARMQGLLEAQQAPRREATPEPTTPAPTLAPVAGKRQKIAVEAWAEQMKVDTGRAIAEALEAHYGLPEGTSLLQVVGSLHAQLQTQQTALQNVYATANDARQASMTNQLASEAEQFRAAHDDYEPSHWTHVEKQLKDYNLPPNRQGLEAAWALAKTNGLVKVSNETTTAPPTSPSIPRLPSLRSGAPGPSVPTVQEIYAQLDKLPDSEVDSFINKWKPYLPKE